MKLLFVYGTLKSNFALNSYLTGGGGNLLEEGSIESRNFVMRDMGSFPALQQVADGNGDVIHGEVWLVSKELLSTLDKVEGSGYKKVRVDVRYGDSVAPCLVYVSKMDTKEITQYPVVKTGRWETSGFEYSDSNDWGEGYCYCDQPTCQWCHPEGEELDVSNYTVKPGVVIRTNFGEDYGPFGDINSAVAAMRYMADELKDVDSVSVGFVIEKVY